MDVPKTLTRIKRTDNLLAMITRIRTIFLALCFWATAITGAEKNVIFFIISSY